MVPAGAKSGSANAAVGVNSDSECEGAFAAVAVTDYESDDSMPDLQAVSDSDSDSMPDLKDVSDSDSDDEPESGAVTDSDWFSEAADEGTSIGECSEGSNWDFDDLFEDPAPAVDAPFALEDPGTPKFMIRVARPTFRRTEMISKILLRFRRSLSELMVPTSRSCALRKFSIPLRLDTPSCLLDNSTTMVLRPLLEVASALFEVLMGRN